MKIYSLISIVIILMILTSCDMIKNKLQESIDNAFEDTTYVVDIPQDIGGKLICNVYYNSDFHSWDYYIYYDYVNNKDTISIGNGRYHGESWEKKEQIIKIGEWYALKTSECWDSDKLLTGKIDTSKKWNEYIFSADSIENTAMWQRGKINSDPNTSDSEVRVISIDRNGDIFVEYDYAIKNRLATFITGDRELIYRIDNKTGIPRLVKIVDE